MVKFRLNIIIVVAIFFLFENSSTAQRGIIPMTDEQRDNLFKNKTGSYHHTVDSIFKLCQIQYFPSDKFVLKDSDECFEFSSGFLRILGCLSPVLESKDENFVAVFKTPYYLIEEISQGKASKEQLTDRHFASMRGALVLSGKYKYSDLPNVSKNELKQGMLYYPPHVKNTFNADTVITCKIPLKRGERFRGKFSHCEMLILTKTDVCCLTLYCFYTKKGYKKRDEYMRETGNIIKYK